MIVQTFTGRVGTIVGRTPQSTPPEAARVFVRIACRIAGDPEVAVVCRYHPDDVRPLHTAPIQGARNG